MELYLRNTQGKNSLKGAKATKESRYAGNRVYTVKERGQEKKKAKEKSTLRLVLRSVRL